MQVNNAGIVGAAMDANAFIAEVTKNNGVSSFCVCVCV